MSAKVSPRPLRTVLPDAGDRINLGPDLRVSPLCIGIVKDPDTISHSFDRGVNFFFVSADMHWPLYENTRQGLRTLFARSASIRDEVVVAVVAYVTQPDFFHTPFNEVLVEIPRLRRIDVTVAGGTYQRRTSLLEQNSFHVTSNLGLERSGELS